MGKSKRVLIAVHPHFRPDRRAKRAGTEADVWVALRRLGHQVRVAGVEEDLDQFGAEVSEFKPHIVFNLLEEFRGEAIFDFHVISLLEARGIPFTGCNPRGLVLSRNKYLTGLVAQGLGVRTPRSWLLFRGEKERLSPAPEFPLFVKLNREHASLGIRESNRVQNPMQLRSTCRRLRDKFDSEILLQDFILGKDVTIGVWGNQRCSALAPRTLHLGGRDRVSTARVKFSASWQKRRVIRSVEFKAECTGRLQKEALLLYRHLDMSGYARFDFRVQEDGTTFLIDVNANPNLAKDEDFVVSSGLPYLEVVEKIIDLGLRYRPDL